MIDAALVFIGGFAGFAATFAIVLRDRFTLGVCVATLLAMMAGAWVF